MHVQFSVRERNEKDRMAHIHPKTECTTVLAEWSERMTKKKKYCSGSDERQQQQQQQPHQQRAKRNELLTKISLDFNWLQVLNRRIGKKSEENVGNEFARNYMNEHGLNTYLHKCTVKSIRWLGARRLPNKRNRQAFSWLIQCITKEFFTKFIEPFFSLSLSLCVCVCSSTTPTQSLPIRNGVLDQKECWRWYVHANANEHQAVLFHISIEMATWSTATTTQSQSQSEREINKKKNVPRNGSHFSTYFIMWMEPFCSVHSMDFSDRDFTIQSKAHPPLHWVVNELLNVKISSRCLRRRFFFLNLPTDEAPTNENKKKIYTSKVCSKA